MAEVRAGGRHAGHVLTRVCRAADARAAAQAGDHERAAAIYAALLASSPNAPPEQCVEWSVKQARSLLELGRFKAATAVCGGCIASAGAWSWRVHSMLGAAHKAQSNVEDEVEARRAAHAAAPADRRAQLEKLLFDALKRLGPSATATGVLESFAADARAAAQAG